MVVENFTRQLACLLALDHLGATAFLYLASNRGIAESASTSDLNFAAVLSDFDGGAGGFACAGQAKRPAPPRTLNASESKVVLFTSGTSGPPKPIVHTWSSLAGAVQNHGRYSGRRWLLTYNQSGFAALQVILQCLLTGGRLSVPASREPDIVCRALVEERVEFATGTPTFWRMLLYGAPPGELIKSSLRQITLGGEVITQDVLDALGRTFPAARLTQYLCIH